MHGRVGVTVLPKVEDAFFYIASHINNSGDVVGWCHLPSNGTNVVTVLFINHQGTSYLLPDLLDSNLYSIPFVEGIADDGSMLVSGYDANNTLHALLLKPN